MGTGTNIPNTVAILHGTGSTVGPNCSKIFADSITTLSIAECFSNRIDVTANTIYLVCYQ